MHLDELITTFDTGLRTLLAPAKPNRARPDIVMAEPPLSPEQKQEAIALMRVNHVGEVCAQALYSGQALTAHHPQITQALKQAANEETDHLAWCEQRIKELGGRKSWLNPLWYTGSFALGVMAGAVADKWNLGFLAETEQQVGAHLDSHLSRLSPDDTKTRTIITQIKLDEMAHAQDAKALGGAELPTPIKAGMKLASKIMTTTAYYI